MNIRLLALILPVLLLAGLTNPALAQKKYTKEQREKAQQETTNLFDKLARYAQNRNYEAFQNKLVYSGSDPYRALQVKLRDNDPHDRLYAERHLARLKKVLDKTAL